MKPSRLLTTSLFAMTMLGVRADIVYLTNGGVLEGKVRYEGNNVIIEQEAGQITLKADRVEHVEKKETNIDLFEKKLVDAGAKEKPSADDYVAAAQFAAERGMRSRAEFAYQKALSIDPDNEAARRALSYEKFQGRWMTSDDANVARGLIKHNGAWVTPEALEDLLKVEKIAAIERARADLLRARADLEQAKSDRLDKELELIEAERDRLREERSEVLTYLPTSYNPYHTKPGPVPQPVAAPQTKTPPPTTSFPPVQVTTPDGTISAGPGGSLIIRK